MKNQYFQLEFRDTIACLHIYPPEDGGKMLSITEVTEYLAAKKLEQYNLKELNAAIVNHQEDSVIMVGPEWIKSLGDFFLRQWGFPWQSSG